MSQDHTHGHAASGGHAHTHTANESRLRLAAILAALVILWTGWVPIDPLLSILVTLLILRSAWFLVRESGHILLEATPRGLDIEAMKLDLTSHIEGLVLVHHVHAWSLTQERPMVTLHARVSDVARAQDIALAIKSRLRARYGVDHVTVEIDRDVERPAF